MGILSNSRIEKIEKSFIYIAIFIFIGLTLFPLIWVFTTSLKPNDETMSFPPKLIPEHVTFENYVFVFTNSTIVKSLYNSLIVSFGSMILNVTICALAGYALARFEFKAKRILFSLILGLFMIPVVINIIPLYSILANLGLLNSLVSLILTFQILIIPLNVILLKNYFETIPKELEESALIDGCSKIGVLRRITIPLSMPGFAVASIFSFIFSWNEFVLPIRTRKFSEFHSFSGGTIPIHIFVQDRMGIPGCRDHYSAVACDYSHRGFPKTNDKRIYFGIDKGIKQIK